MSPNSHNTAQEPLLPKTRIAMVLTLRTNPNHHEIMTALCDKYLPGQINMLAGHISLFHSLPGSKLDESTIPGIEDIRRSGTSCSLEKTTTTEGPEEAGSRILIQEGSHIGTFVSLFFYVNVTGFFVSPSTMSPIKSLLRFLFLSSSIASVSILSSTSSSSGGIPTQQ
jgi:hypothetical protein